MTVENTYKWIFKWLKYDYPREYCFDNIIEIIKNEKPNFLLKNRYLNETLYDIGKDYAPLNSILLPTFLKNGEYIIDPILDMDIHYDLLSKYKLPKGCFFLNNHNIIDLEKNIIFHKYSKL